MINEQIRRPDGTYQRRDDTMWIDDVYMSVPFLIRYADVDPEAETLDEACRQILHFRDYFEIPHHDGDGGSLMAHMRDLHRKSANGIPWSRGNAWVLFFLSEILMALPQTHHAREELRSFFLRLCKGYQSVQDISGLWHQVRDEPDTYLETSGSAMFLCVMARGVRYGFLMIPMGQGL